MKIGEIRRLKLIIARTVFILGVVCFALNLASCTVGVMPQGRGMIALPDRCALWEQYYCRLRGHVSAQGSERDFMMTVWVSPDKVRVDVVSGWGSTIAVGIFGKGGDNRVWFPSKREVYVSEDGRSLVKHLLGVEFSPLKIDELISGCGPDIGSATKGEGLQKVVLEADRRVAAEYDPPFKLSDPKAHPRHILIKAEEGTVSLTVEAVEWRNVGDEVYRLPLSEGVKILYL